MNDKTSALDKTAHSHQGLISWFIPIGLFLLALIARMPTLGKFLTQDEPLWVEHSRHFLAGLLDPAHVCRPPIDLTPFEQVGLACTLQTFHPGVTTMWTGSLGISWRYLADGMPGHLLDYVLSIQTNPLDLRLVAPARLPTVLLTSLGVVAMYWLVSRLFADQRAGLMAGLLLALDPFHVALSRIIHTDAMATVFMTLSLLTALVYWGHREKGRWLIASGVLAGLAFLSKSLALFLVPFVALVAAWSLVDRRARGEPLAWGRVSTTIVEWMLWFNCTAITFVALWPAMWIVPARALHAIFFLGMYIAQAGHLNFFLGNVSPDPGPFFYPVTWLLRSSPLIWAGLALAVIQIFRGGLSTHRKSDASASTQPIKSPRGRGTSFWSDTSTEKYLALLLLYALLFIVVMSLSTKKQDRYILPVYPVMNIVAAVGLVHISDHVKDALPREGPRTQANEPAKRKRFKSKLVFGLVALFQGVLIIINYPYYFTYYNPLLGGTRTAEKLVTIGWGEGLDLAAAYLNQKPNADQLEVSAWLDQVFAPYFQGRTTGLFSELSVIDQVLSQDYLVVYVNQRQRQIMDRLLAAYFGKHHAPEYTVRLHGVDYALVYAVPVERHTAWQMPEEVASTRLILYGYRQASAQPGVLTLILVWQNKGMSAEVGFWAGLQGSLESETLVWQPCALAPGFTREEAQQVGALVESVCTFSTEDLEPGIYSLRIGLGPAADQRALEGPGNLLEPGRMIDLLAPEGEWKVSIPDSGAPARILRNTD